MKLYLIRHAHAVDRIEFSKTGKMDEERYLIGKGHDRMGKVLKRFIQLEPEIQHILQSNLLRSQQTAEILKRFYPNAKVTTASNLNPGLSAKRLYDEIQAYDLDSLAIVGHEPDLGQFLSWLLFQQATDHFPIKKCGIAKIDLYKDGRCYLKWLLRPSLLF